MPFYNNNNQQKTRSTDARCGALFVLSNDNDRTMKYAMRGINELGDGFEKVVPPNANDRDAFFLSSLPI